VRQYERKFWQLLKENRDVRISLIELHSQLSQAAQVESSLQAQLVAVQAQLVTQVHLTESQAQYIAKFDQPASLERSIKDSLHLLRVKLTPPGSRREHWYEALRRRKTQ
jgi:cell division septum initiation protein DivIVA